MIVTIVNVWVKSESRDEFVVATKANLVESVKEVGNLRFDFLQDAQDECKFTLYEAYESEAAAALHKETLHYFKWRDTVANLMARPREGIKHTVISPNDKTLW